MHTIRDFLFSKTNREFLIFLLFLLLSGIFWLMMTFNETYEKEIVLPVRYFNVPQSAVLTSGESDSIHVNISDKGFSLFAFIYSRDSHTIDIDFTKYALPDGIGSVPAIDLQHMIEQLLPTSAKITSLKTEKLVFYYNNGEKKKVPVRWRGHLKTDPHYFIAKTLIEPDSVTIFASREKLDSIHYVYTRELNYSDIHDTLIVTSELQRMQGVKIVPNRVKINIQTDVLTEETIDSIPVVGINMPKGKVLRTFPSRVSVKIVTGMKNYKAIMPSDILVVADYEQFKDETSDKCTLQVKKVPEGVSRATLNVKQVDYLIEEQ
ncbi:YbbR-like domain-containing protein [Prevotella communis]|uniref:YbbR-like domain-containing protein n=1 Tax=Prevotella communis TaxID=2913614 RepID=UPI001EDC5B40|nr:YbbR-like domain-containing protein [Prevotella communis]UKK58144.1 YbbR-like domain-containing protein [Prevotella communis]